MGKKKRKKYYAYFIEGGETGVTDEWSRCEAMVKGRPARYKGFPTREEALEWLERGACYERKDTGRLRNGPGSGRRTVPGPVLPEDAVYFDSGTGRGLGTEVRVTDRDGTSLLHLVIDSSELTAEGNLRLTGRTNNFGELLACRFALEIACKLDRRIVMGDSKLVIDYWSRGMIRKETSSSDRDLAELVERVRRLRKRFEATGGRLVHISGDVNPADLGFHR